MRKAAALVAATLLAGMGAGSAAAASGGIGVDERPGVQVPLDLTFRDASGEQVILRDLLSAPAPTVLVLAYFRCPMLCDQVLGGLAHSLPATRLAAGTDYRVLAISFDPADTPADAAAKAGALLGSADAFDRARWRFVVDHEGSAAQLAERIGFGYRFDPATDQFAHPAVVFVLSPSGIVARYLYGIGFTPTALAPALDDAAGERSRPALERVLLQCFRYVPALERYAGTVAWVIRGGGSALFLAIGLSLVWLVRRERRARGRRHA